MPKEVWWVLGLGQPRARDRSLSATSTTPGAACLGLCRGLWLTQLPSQGLLGCPRSAAGGARGLVPLGGGLVGNPEHLLSLHQDLISVAPKLYLILRSLGPDLGKGYFFYFFFKVGF